MKRALLASLLVAACSSGEVKITQENKADFNPISVARVRVDRGTLRRSGAELRFDAAPSPWRSTSPKLDLTLPARGDGALRIARADDPDLWIELASNGRPVESEIVRASAVYRDVRVDTDAVLVAETARIEELRVLRTPNAPSTTTWTLRLGPHAMRARVIDDRVEILDEAGRIALATEPAFARDARGVERRVALSLEDDRLIARLDVEGLVHPIVVDPTWVGTSDMGTYWNGRAMSLAKGGDTVLLVGGVHTTTLPTGPVQESATANAWTWNIAGGNFRPIASMSQPRDAFAIAQIQSNNFLVIGGDNYGGLGDTPNCEIYDPIHTKWSAAAPMSIARRDFDAVVLQDGKVLVVGGLSHDVPTAKAELYDPSSNTWQSAGNLRRASQGPHVVLLDDGRVLAAGGNDYKTPGTVFASVDLYDESTNTWTAGPDMLSPRDGFGLVKLASGKIIAFGGRSQTADRIASSEIFDPQTSAWSEGPPLPEAWGSFDLTTLDSGNVLVVGGNDDDFTWASENAAVLDVNAVTFSKTTPMSTGRLGAYLASVKDSALVGGGLTNPHGTTATAEVFTPLSNGDACTLDGDCASLHCVDGVCCDKPCGDACFACDVAAHSGTCTAVLGTPHGRRACSDPSMTCTESGCSNGEPAPSTGSGDAGHAQTFYSCAISTEKNGGFDAAWLALLALAARTKRRRSRASRYAR